MFWKKNSWLRKGGGNLEIEGRVFIKKQREKRIRQKGGFERVWDCHRRKKQKNWGFACGNKKTGENH